MHLTSIISFKQQMQYYLRLDLVNVMNDWKQGRDSRFQDSVGFLFLDANWAHCLGARVPIAYIGGVLMRRTDGASCPVGILSSSLHFSPCHIAPSSRSLSFLITSLYHIITGAASQKQGYHFIVLKRVMRLFVFIKWDEG